MSHSVRITSRRIDKWQRISGPLKPLVREADAATPPRQPRERYPQYWQIHETYLHTRSRLESSISLEKIENSPNQVLHKELSIDTMRFTSWPSFSNTALSLRRLSSSPNLHLSLSGTSVTGNATLIAAFSAEEQLRPVMVDTYARFSAVVERASLLKNSASIDTSEQGLLNRC